MRLALFDLDNTLLAGDSDFEWAQFLIEKGVLDREVYEARNQQFYEHYKAGMLDIHAFLDFQLKPLSRHPRRILDEWHREFLRMRILPIITFIEIARLAWGFRRRLYGVNDPRRSRTAPPPPMPAAPAQPPRLGGEAPRPGARPGPGAAHPLQHDQ